jgi:division protein CdvB (Snf7/Vps24/ESCRT-III family)
MGGSMSTRQRSGDISVIQEGVISDLKEIGDLMGELVGAKVIEPDGALMEAFNGLATYVAITLRVLARTNPSKIAEAAKHVELQSLIPPGELTEDRIRAALKL